MRRALGNPEAQPAGVSGRGRFRGRWGGSLDWPVFEGRFEGSEIGYAGVAWGEAAWSGSFDTAAEAITSHPLVLRKAGAEIEWDGRSEVGWLGQKDALAGRARATRWPVEDLVALHGVGRGGERAGERDARASAAGAAPPRARRRARARDGRYYGVAYDEARLESRWQRAPRRGDARRAAPRRRPRPLPRAA